MEILWHTYTYSDLYFWGSLYQILLPALELVATLYVIYFSRTPSWNLIRAVLDRKIQSNSYSRAIHTDPNYIENVEYKKYDYFPTECELKNINLEKGYNFE